MILGNIIVVDKKEREHYNLPETPIQLVSASSDGKIAYVVNPMHGKRKDEPHWAAIHHTEFSIVVTKRHNA